MAPSRLACRSCSGERGGGGGVRTSPLFSRSMLPGRAINIHQSHLRLAARRRKPIRTGKLDRNYPRGLLPNDPASSILAAHHLRILAHHLKFYRFILSPLSLYIYIYSYFKEKKVNKYNRAARRASGALSSIGSN